MGAIHKMQSKWKVLRPTTIRELSDSERRRYNNLKKQESRARAKGEKLKFGRPTHVQCRHCEETKKFDETNFKKQQTASWGLTKTCIPCSKAVRLSRRYGLTPKEYLNKTTGSCAICQTPGKLFMDHCHNTGNNREGLCGSCNSGLGFFRDDPERLRTAALYIEKHQMLA